MKRYGSKSSNSSISSASTHTSADKFSWVYSSMHSNFGFLTERYTVEISDDKLPSKPEQNSNYIIRKHMVEFKFHSFQITWACNVHRSQCLLIKIRFFHGMFIQQTSRQACIPMLLKLVSVLEELQKFYPPNGKW